MSSFSARALLALLPGAYFVQTRVKDLRDLLYLLGTSFVPAAWFLYRSTDLGVDGALLSFGLGYLAFIAVYELGYLANDRWDAERGPGGRKRMPFKAGAPFLLAFVALRLLVWTAVAASTEWWRNPVWLGGFAALAAAFTLHNILRSPEARSASFVQLAVLRFSLPVIGPLPVALVPLLLLLALLLYAYLRWLGYLDSKALLAMPARKDRHFGTVQMAVLAPVIFFVAVVAGSTLPLELWAWYLFLYAAWGSLKREQRQP